VQKTEEKRTLGKLRCRWKDNIKIDLKKGGWSGRGLDLFGSVQGKLAGSFECGDV